MLFRRSTEMLISNPAEGNKEELLFLMSLRPHCGLRSGPRQRGEVSIPRFRHDSAVRLPLGGIRLYSSHALIRLLPGG